MIAWYVFEPMMYGKLAVGVWRLNVTWSPRGPATMTSELRTPLVEEIACEPDVGSASCFQVETTSSGARDLPATPTTSCNLSSDCSWTYQSEASLSGFYLSMPSEVGVSSIVR